MEPEWYNHDSWLPTVMLGVVIVGVVAACVLCALSAVTP